MTSPEKNPLLQSTALPEETGQDVALRPKTLTDFVGQPQLKANLEVFIASAKARGGALDHVLFAGPPGLGKTSLAHILANELGVGFRATSGPVIAKGGDLAAILTSLQPHDVLFIDEIHRLSAAVEEILYPAMEDYKLDLVIGEGPAARTVRVDVPPFTLVGATTRAGMLSNPLRDRFGVYGRLEFYEAADLEKVLHRAAGLLGFPLETAAAKELASRSRGTPRLANRLLRRVRDFATVQQESTLTLATTRHALQRLGVDDHGLDASDHRYLQALVKKFSGGPVGLATLAASTGESEDTLEDMVEPYLLQLGFISRTPRGRVATEMASRYVHQLQNVA